MKFRTRAQHLFQGIRAALSLTDARGWEGTTVLGARTITGRSITPELARQLSAYWACVRTISEDVGKLPRFVFKRLDGGKERAKDHPAFRLLRTAPNPAVTNTTFFEMITAWALSWGNGYAEIQPDVSGKPIALWPIQPWRVRVSQASDGSLMYHVKMAGTTTTQDLPASQIIHIRGLGDSVLGGLSIAQIAATSLDLGLSQQEFAASFLGNAGAVSGILQHPGTITEDAAKRLRESWHEQHGGPTKAGTVAVLEEGMTFEPVTMRLTDAQFLQSRKFTVEEIARWFRMPPHKIQHLERSTFSNIESQSIEYVTDTLMPWLVRWEEELDRKLVPEEDFFVEHNVQALLRGDAAARAKFYKDLFGIGALSQNDVRKLENMNSVDGGDVYYVPVNLAPVAKAPGTTTPALPVAPAAPAAGSPTIDAIIPAALDAARRMARKEEKGIGRALRKTTGLETREAIERFFLAHVIHITEALGPSISMTLGEGAVNGELKTLADSLCADLKSRALNDPQSVIEAIDRGEFVKARTVDIVGRLHDLISTVQRDMVLTKIGDDNGD